jgi:RNase P subunit RPR2
MRIPWLPQEYTRTCLECGESWQVPRAERRQVRSIRLLSRGAAASGIPRQVTSIMADNERERIFAQCPNCGAEHFTQRASPVSR